VGGLGGASRGVNGVVWGVFGAWARDVGSGVCSSVGGVVEGRAFLFGKVVLVGRK
jgi:hypothetical protein